VLGQASTRARASPTGPPAADKRQIDYAIGDVTTSPKIFPKLLKKLIKTGRGGWLDEEMERLADPSNYANEPDDAWKRLKRAEPQPRVLGRLKALAAWRETEARGKNIPRGRIMQGRDAGRARQPSAQDPGRPRQGARACRPDGRQRHRRAADGRAQATASPLGDEELPSARAEPTGLTKDAALVSDLLKLLLKIRAKESGVAPS
jgi:ribonuclease D